MYVFAVIFKDAAILPFFYNAKAGHFPIFIIGIHFDVTTTIT